MYMNSKNLVGMKFGRLTVLFDSGERRHGQVVWTCSCECGKETNIVSQSLKVGDTKSCGCLKTEQHKKNLLGQKFNLLTVIADTHKQNNKKCCIWLCQCDCGNQKEVSSESLLRGSTKSCGCLYRCAANQARKTRTYNTWAAMRERISNPNHQNYKYYGGRGIKICERWNDFRNFLEDMGERPDDRTLDRIDVNGNYEPGNCRWATRSEQTRNTQKSVIKNILNF